VPRKCAVVRSGEGKGKLRKGCYFAKNGHAFCDKVVADKLTCNASSPDKRKSAKSSRSSSSSSKSTRKSYRKASRKVQSASKWLPQKHRSPSRKAQAASKWLPKRTKSETKLLSSPQVVKVKSPPKNSKKPHCVKVRGGKTLSCHSTAKAAYNKMMKLRAKGSNAIARINTLSGLR
jgi:hypothetical protein